MRCEVARRPFLGAKRGERGRGGYRRLAPARMKNINRRRAQASSHGADLAQVGRVLSLQLALELLELLDLLPQVLLLEGARRGDAIGGG